MSMEIRDLFITEHGSFSKILQFKTVLIIIAIIIFFNTFFKKSYGAVIILIAFAIYIANNYVIIQNDKTKDFNRITMVKLNSLQNKSIQYIDSQVDLILNSNPNKMPQSEIEKLYKRHVLDCLYMDANLINFLFSIVKLYDYNPGEYYSLLQGTNNILKIQKDIDIFYKSNGVYPENTSELFQGVLELKQKTINNMHNFIYTVPKMGIMNNYINDSINRYSVLISRVTDSIHENYKKNIKQRGINSTTKFITYNTTKDFDTMDNHSVINNEQKLVSFYI